MSASEKYVNNSMYGVYPSTKTIEYYLELIADFVLENSYTLDDTEMINELIDYSFEAKRKFDIIAAMGIDFTCPSLKWFKVIKQFRKIGED